MRRVLAMILLGWVLVLAAAVPATATDGPGDLPSGNCTGDGTDDDPFLCDPDTNSGSGVPGAFVGIFAIVVLVGVGTTIYKVGMARDMARKSGMDADQATAMTLLTDDGLEATYLASNLRPPVAASKPTSDRPVSERLAELKSLLDQGLVTQAEYDERRAAILGSL